LAELLQIHGLNQTEAATKLNLTRPYLNGVINGKYPLNTELRLKLKPVLGVEAEYWTEVQRAYDMWKESPEGRRLRIEQGREELHNLLDLRGAHVLLANEITEAIRGGVIEVSHFDFTQENDQCRLLQTSLQLTFGRQAWIKTIGTDEEKEVSVRSGFVLKRGQMVLFATREALTLSSRVRAHVNGLTEHWATRFIHCFHQRLLEPGSTGQITFGMINAGPTDIEISEGEPCLSVSFEYLAQDPATRA
jgi:addiction module HigA family antidote